MGGCRCSYRNCKSATKLSDNLHFFHYPVKHSERCKQWIINAQKQNFFELSEDQLRNKVVCELHFEDTCFTNPQKKRLLHDAIPTLDGDSQDEEVNNYQAQRNFENVQVLPANADGTIFMVDTDSMQQMPESKIESYILRNGSVVPLHRKNPQNTNVKISFVNTKSVINNHSSIPSGDTPNDFFETAPVVDEMKILFDENTFMRSNEELKNLNRNENQQTQIPENLENFINYNNVKENLKKSNNEQRQMNKKHKKITNVKNTKHKFVYEKIRQHSRDIAVIKKLLHNNIIPKSVNKNSVLNYLKKRVPSTILDLVNINLNKTQVVSVKNVEFFRSINMYSPELYKMLREKYKWILPEFNIETV